MNQIEIDDTVTLINRLATQVWDGRLTLDELQRRVGTLTIQAPVARSEPFAQPVSPQARIVRALATLLLPNSVEVGIAEGVDGSARCVVMAVKTRSMSEWSVREARDNYLNTLGPPRFDELRPYQRELLDKLDL